LFEMQRSKIMLPDKTKRQWKVGLISRAVCGWRVLDEGFGGEVEVKRGAKSQLQTRSWL
jgi:hypothetical protein